MKLKKFSQDELTGIVLDYVYWKNSPTHEINLQVKCEIPKVLSRLENNNLTSLQWLLMASGDNQIVIEQIRHELETRKRLC